VGASEVVEQVVEQDLHGEHGQERQEQGGSRHITGGTMVAVTIGMLLFPNMVTPPPYRSNARRELRRITLELERQAEHARALDRSAAADAALAFKAIAADVRVAALRARAAQLRRAAGRLTPAEK
jgi:hypothetical protein